MPAFFRDLRRVSLGALTFVAAAGVAQTPRLEVPRIHYFAMITSSQFIINGEVTERTDTGFTVISRTSELTTLLVTADTSITKGAVTIHLSDLMVADKVSVTAMRAADGKLVAVNVIVRVGNE